METVWLDFRWTVRTLARRPAGSLAVVGILASAIAAATVLGTAFTVIVYDRPPVDSPETVARVWLADHTRPAGHRPAPADDFRVWKDATRTLTAVTAFVDEDGIVGGADGARVRMLRVTADYFKLVQQQPSLGRAFTPAGGPDVAIISHRLWRERFASDPGVIGRRVNVDAKAREIVGVMPAGFWFPSRGIDVWLPLRLDSDVREVDVAGRLVSGVGWSDVQSEFDVLAQRGSSSGVPSTRIHALVRSLATEARLKLGPGLEGLVAPALVILLIACANVGNLLIMRTVGREKELAIRAVLGATAARLARLSLVEASLIAIAAGIIGAVLSTWGIGLLSVALEGARPGFGESLHGGWAAVVVAGIATLVTLLGTGMLPTLSAARRDLSAGLGERSRRPLASVFQYTIGDVMVVLQVALAVVLVLVTALFVRLFAEFNRLEQPKASRDAYVTTLATPADMAQAARANLYRRVLDEVGANAAFDATALATDLPVLWRGERVPIVAASASGSMECRVGASYVSATYFDVVRLPLERGSLPSGTAGTAGVAAVVSAGAARTCWGSGSSQEWRVRLPRPPSPGDAPQADVWIPVVAVVADPFGASTIKQFITSSYVWVIGTRYWPQDVFLLFRPRPGDRNFATELARSIGRASPNVATEPVHALADSDSESGMRALEISVLAAVALLALMLAFTGVYAALSHSCARRLMEFGIRLALGADARRLVAAAVGRDAPLVAAGIAVGLVGTLWVTTITWRDLLVISALDPRVWIAVCAILGGAGFLAMLGPILRAIRVDPIGALRAE